MKKGLLVLALGAVLFTACGTATPPAEMITVTAPAETITEAAPVEAEPDANLEILRGAWNALPASDRASLCEFYNTPPVGTTPQMVRIFDREAGLGYAESERVLNIVLAEECWSY